MLKYNDESSLFEFSQDTFDNYIDQQFEKNRTSWNKPQLMIIVETLGNFINHIFEIYRHYPGECVNILKKMKAVNDIQQDANHTFLKEIIAMEKQHNLLKKIAREIVRPYQMCIGNLNYMKLDGLQKRSCFSDQQLQDLKEIVSTFLNDAIQTITKSSMFKASEQAGQLYYDINQLSLPNSYREDFFPSPMDLSKMFTSLKM